MEHELCKYTRDEMTTHMIGNKSEPGMDSMSGPTSLHKMKYSPQQVSCVGMTSEGKRERKKKKKQQSSATV